MNRSDKAGKGRDGALRRPTKSRRIRKQLPHDVPNWVNLDDAIYFITVCCRIRGSNQLAQPEIAQQLLESIEYRHRNDDWYMHVAVLMPDHVHLITSFPERSRNIQTVVSKWKEWTAKSLKIKWQRDFFEHRLRRDESFVEKADYVRNNPVRAGFVTKPEEWPYKFLTEQWW